MLLKNRNKSKNSSSTQYGFTIIEVLVVAPIVVLVIGAFVGLIVSMTGDILATRAANVMAYDIQDALNRIEQDVKRSGAYLATNNIELTSPQGFDNGTSNFQNAGPDGPMLILNTYATTGNPTSTDTGFVYIANQPNACGSGQITDNQIVMFNTVYFVRDNSLWRRTVAPADYDTMGCSLPWQQPTCAPGISGAFCATQDERLLDGITEGGFELEYFADPSEAGHNTTASDSEALTADRTAALQTITTVRVAISVEKTVAGRTFGQSGVTRAISVNDDTSIAVIEDSAPVVTSHPQKTTILATDTNVDTFTVSFIGNPEPSVQWQQSTNYGSTWSDVPGANSATLTFASVNDPMDGDLFRAVLTNSLGQATSDSAMLIVNNPEWQQLDMRNNWTLYNSSYSTSFMKTTDGVVVVRAMVKKSTTPNSLEVIAMLPEGFRPSHRIQFSAMTSGNLMAAVDITSTGGIRYRSGSNVWMSLEGISFIPEGGRYTPTNIATFSNSWVNYGSDLAPASYVVDSIGRVHLQGVVKSGTMTNGSQVFNLPNNLLPSLYMHVPTLAEANGFSMYGLEHRVGVVATGVVAKGVGTNGYYSIQGMFYPGALSGWNNLSLQNGWVWYGTIYSTPQYTKGADGLVKLKGLIGSGTITAGTVIATLPVGYRPSSYMVYKVVSANILGRVDINPNGNVIFQNGSSTWLSLDNIQFMGEN